MRVIINADDLGISSIINQAIEKCIINGEITSTSVMAGAKAFAEGIEIVKKYPQISVGVHLTIDEEMSLTKSPIFLKYGIMDYNGHFIKSAISKVPKFTNELKEAIYAEWDMQINAVKNTGIIVSHVDSHHHYHTIPELKNVLFCLMRENGVKRIRLCSNKMFKMYIHRKEIKKTLFPSTGIVNQRIKQKKIMLWLPIFINIFKIYRWNRSAKKKFFTADYFCSYAFYIINKDFFVKYYPKVTIELMCHPGNTNYEQETIRLKELPFDVKKINYNDL